MTGRSVAPDEEKRQPWVRSSDQGFAVRQVVEGELTLAKWLPEFTPPERKRAIEEAPYWKKVHTAAETLYQDYRKFLHHVHLFQVCSRLDCPDHARMHQEDARNALDEMMPKIMEFGVTLADLLEKAEQAGLNLSGKAAIQELAKVVRCTDAIWFHLGNEWQEGEMTHCLALIDRIADWLLRMLTRSDKALENFFAARPKQRGSIDAHLRH